MEGPRPRGLNRRTPAMLTCYADGPRGRGPSIDFKLTGAWDNPKIARLSPNTHTPTARPMSHFEADLHDPVFRRLCIVVAACLVALVAGFMLTESAYLVFAATLAFGYISTLTVNQKTLAWLVIALQPAALIIPFFPGRPFFWELCALLSWPSLLAYFVINRPKLEVLRLDRIERGALLALLGYVAVLFVLMATRGVGFRALGGAQMGGRFYTQQLVLSILPLLLIAANLSRTKILLAVWVGWSLTTTYLISDFSFSVPGKLSSLLYFFEIPTDAINFEVGYEVTGLRRRQSLWFVGAALICALLVSVRLKDVFGKYIWFAPLLLLGFFGLALLSGHRAAFVQTVMTLGFLSIFQRFWSPRHVVAVAFFTVASVICLYQFAAELPLSIQRAVSFLPSIPVSELAKTDATNTLSDRIEVLKLAVNDFSNYWLLGRGFGMERFDLLPNDEMHSGIWLQYTNGYFYNGLLGIILKTGLPGLIFSTWFILMISKLALRLVKTIQAQPTTWSGFDRLCLLFAAQWFSTVIYFYFLHGDAGVWGLVFLFPASLIIACKKVYPENTQLALSK